MSEEPIEPQPVSGVEEPTAAHAPKRGEDIPTGGRLLLGWVLVLTSIVLLALGWYGVSGNPQVAVQLAYLASGGLGGLLAGIVGSALLLSNDIRRDRERLGRVEGSVLELREILVAQADVLRDLQAHSNGSSPRRARKAAAGPERTPEESTLETTPDPARG